MKPNRYTYIIDWLDDKKILFNGMNKEFIVMPKEISSSISTILSSPDKYISSHPAIIKQLTKKGFVVNDDFDERMYLASARDSFIKAKEYKTTILPTFECNYSCWYCVQKHTPLKLEKGKFELIIKHIKKYLIDNDIESYVLSWFGGEPLTQPSIIDMVSSQLLEFCREHNIEFSGGVTSNGALLTSETIEMLKRNRINYYQIAIDGDEKAHNTVKFNNSDKSSFSTVLTNISNLIERNPDVSVTLRLNYTLAMLNSEDLVNDICRYLNPLVRKNIIVDLQKVWQIKEETIPMEKLFKLQERLVDEGFLLEINHVFNICYVEKEHYNMFYYNGGVEKCDKRPVDNLRGYLDENGDIVWREKPVFSDFNLFEEGCVCNECDYFPLCYNGCPILREERINEFGKVVCGHSNVYQLLEQRILDYCYRVIQNNRLQHAF